MDASDVDRIDQVCNRNFPKCTYCSLHFGSILRRNELSSVKVLVLVDGDCRPDWDSETTLFLSPLCLFGDVELVVRHDEFLELAFKPTYCPFTNIFHAHFPSEIFFF